MQVVHTELWNRCRQFVATACAGRDASHGLMHMHKVTEQALLLYLMGHKGEAGPRRDADLYRIILLGMLHDVADHKYDHDGTLFARVEAFVEAEARRMVEWMAVNRAPDTLSAPQLAAIKTGDAQATVQAALLTSIDAISYSKENARGMRWFERILPSEWCDVRDIVSDADKLEAIGEEGLLRCYEYTCSRYRHKALAHSAQQHCPAFPTSKTVEEVAATLRQLEAALLKDVVAHFGEKLSRLASEYIVTEQGKYLAAPRHAAMVDLLSEWQKHGPPPVTLFWRGAAAEYLL